MRHRASFADPRNRETGIAVTEPGTSDDTAGNWLADCFQLTSRDRERVKTATLRGEPVSDPRLKEAVCGLASEILGNRLRMPGIAWYYTIGTAAGVFGIVLLGLALTGQHGGPEIAGILSAALAFYQMITGFVSLPQQRRKKVAKALRVNSGIERPPEP